MSNVFDDLDIPEPDQCDSVNPVPDMFGGSLPCVRDLNHRHFHVDRLGRSWEDQEPFTPGIFNPPAPMPQTEWDRWRKPGG